MPAERKGLGLESLNDASVYTILTIPKKVSDMSANLKAPIVINNKTKKGRQIVLQDSKLAVDFKMYHGIKEAMSRRMPEAEDMAADKEPNSPSRRSNIGPEGK